MSPIVREDPKVAKQLNRLEHLNQLLSEIATAILPGNDAFESAWSAANRVYDRYYSPNMRFITRPGVDESGRTALSA